MTDDRWAGNVWNSDMVDDRVAGKNSYDDMADIRREEGLTC